VRAFLRPVPSGADGEHAHGEAAPSMVVPLVLTAVACVALFLGVDIVLSPLASILEVP